MVAQPYLLAPPDSPDGDGTACPDCGKPVSPLFGPAQRALLPDAPEVHITCLEKRNQTNDRRQ